MSRLRLLAQNISSGYVQVAANAIFILVSVPLALHYLSTKEYGLLQLVTQVVGYLSLVDLGMTGAMTRVLIDHKDHPSDGTYGSVIKTSGLVLLAQGTVLGILASALGFWLPGLMEIPTGYADSFRLLFLGYGVLTGAMFPSRMLAGILQAHQRYDLTNYSAVASYAVNLAVLWLSLRSGLGLFSLLAAHAAGSIATVLFQAIATVRLTLLPPRGAWGRWDRKILREIFLFGSDLFLMSVGLQLLNASQLVIIKATLGFEAVAIWSIATKAFSMAQQFVWRLWDFSTSAIAEMVVRNERARLRQRFQEIFLVTASVSVFVGMTVAVCNESFLAVWTSNGISWNGINNFLMGLLFFINSLTRLHVGLLGPTKKIRGMRYVYFLEGLCFVTAAFFAAREWGMPGIIWSAILMDAVWSGIYGTFRTAEEFDLKFGQVALHWIMPTLRFALALALVALPGWWFLRPLSPLGRLVISAALMAAIGLPLLWKLGLTPSLREEFTAAATKTRGRLRSGAR